MSDLDDGLLERPVDDVDDGLLEDDTTGSATEAPENHYKNVYVFVRDFLIHVYARRVGRQITHTRWCPQWWMHDEAVARLESLWKAFEALRQDPGIGASVWWRDHADPCMAQLMAPNGPFERCSESEHYDVAPLPMAELKAWMIEADGAAL